MIKFLKVLGIIQYIAGVVLLISVPLFLAKERVPATTELIDVAYGIAACLASIISGVIFQAFAKLLENQERLLENQELMKEKMGIAPKKPERHKNQHERTERESLGNL